MRVIAQACAIDNYHPFREWSYCATEHSGKNVPSWVPFLFLLSFSFLSFCGVHTRREPNYVTKHSGKNVPQWDEKGLNCLREWRWGSGEENLHLIARAGCGDSNSWAAKWSDLLIGWVVKEWVVKRMSCLEVQLRRDAFLLVICQDKWVASGSNFAAERLCVHGLKSASCWVAKVSCKRNGMLGVRLCDSILSFIF